MKKIKVSLFTYSTLVPHRSMGEELSKMLADRWSLHQVGDLTIELETIYDGDPKDAIIAALKDDIVIFDASLDNVLEGGTSNFATQYRAAAEWMLLMEHFLIVSRTKLPINFVPYSNAGGYPFSLGTSYREEKYGIPLLRNEDLVEWIEKKIQELSLQLPLPRLDKRHIDLKSPLHNLESLINDLTIKSRERYIRNEKSKGRAFISYLSKYSNKAEGSQPIHGLYVEDLKKHIRKRKSDPEYPVRYFPPGELSSEFMDEFRRWQVVSVLENAIRAADEFWIFETDDYYDSWWTQAELFVLAYILYKPNHPLFGECKPPKVMICRPLKSGKLKTEKSSLDFIQKLDSRTGHELWWRLELSKKYDYTKPDIGRILKSRFPGISEVDLDNFFNSQILTCHKCVRRNIDKSHLNLSTFIANEQKGQHRVRSQNLRTSHAPEICKIVDCPVCNTSYKLNVSSRQYRWWPAKKDGSPTGPEGVYVEMRLRYKIKEHKEPSKQEIEAQLDRLYGDERPASRKSYNSKEKTGISVCESQSSAQIRDDQQSIKRFLYWGIGGVTASLILVAIFLISSQKNSPLTATTDSPSPKTNISQEGRYPSHITPFSSVEMNYANLENYLQSQSWKEANLETRSLLRQAVGLENGEPFSENDMENFPCVPLIEIDKLWNAYSDNRFGFNVQSEIAGDVGEPVEIISLGGPYSFNENAWNEFSGEVGWGSYSSPITEPDYSLQAPVGHLPWSPSSVSGVFSSGILLLRTTGCAIQQMAE